MPAKNTRDAGSVEVERAHVDGGGVAPAEQRSDHEQDGDDQDEQGCDEHGHFLSEGPNN